MLKRRIMAPGPTEIPPSVLSIASEPILHHRTPQFRAVFAEVSEKIKYVFQTEQPVLTLAAGGTGGLEAVIVNLTASGDKVIVISGGVFGERWAKIAEAIGRVPVRIAVEWGQAVDPEVVRSTLAANPDAVLVCGTLSETSTGVEHPIEEIAKIVSESSACFAVDAVSGLAACVLKMDAWKIDAVVAGTQKGLMMPPGLAMISLSEKAWKQVKAKNSPKFYWSFEKALTKMTAEKLPDTPFTPNVSLIMQLRESLRLIEAEGIEAIWARHALLARATRAGVEAFGLKLYAPTAPNPGVTAVWSPEGIDSGQIVKKMRDEWGVSIVGGQEKLLGKIFRIGHMGYADRADVLLTLGVLEVVLTELGAKINRGQGVSAAQDVFLSAK
jgi:serine---pyruvate transaminase